jgi:hypothetical protein
VEKAQENLSALGIEGQGLKVVLADAGYCSEANLEKIDPSGPEHLIAIRKDWKQRQALLELPSPRGRIPHHFSRRDRMERKRLTRRGLGMAVKRSCRLSCALWHSFHPSLAPHVA